MINQYTSIEDNNSATNPTNTRIKLIRTFGCRQVQGNIFQCYQHVLKTAGNYFH